MRLALVLLAAASLSAQPKPCSAPEFRQFDFWIGEWEVHANGKIAGTNRIKSIYNGCVLEERWDGVSGVSGASFNSFEPETGLWHQAWVDSTGGRLALSGKFENGRMTLSGRRADGGIDRITWTPNQDGTVRQLWETSKDGVKWETSFDGLYKRLK